MVDAYSKSDTPPRTELFSGYRIGQDLPSDRSPNERKGESLSMESQPCHSLDEVFGEECDVLSILNVAVDYVMVAPTPLEPDEFNWMLQKIQRNMVESYPNSDCEDDVLVPVMRIFGPVTRPLPTTSISQSSSTPCAAGSVDTNQNYSDPLMNYQSGCLHIHGAFPYMLARPVLAGIDGSPFANNDFSRGHHVNWDDRESVQSITSDIHMALEGALKAYFHTESLRTLGKSSQRLHKGLESTGVNAESIHPMQEEAAQSLTRFIRFVSVVIGRGFYTYSLGPPAPFLRVEYYNPKLRWIVKALLEQGLDLSSNINPHPSKYEPIKLNGLCTTTDERLAFHCFEAHIPYTMQVFKDLNISGMSPVLVRDCRFRTPLPRHKRIRIVKNQQTGRMEDENLNVQSSNEEIFLQGNIKESLVWKTICIRDDFPADELWTRKESSCDVEADTTVESISNAYQIIRYDDDKAKDENIHWRAVPSLYEIWEEEKRRMQMLMSRRSESLANAVQFNFDAPTAKSGSRLALVSAERLFDSSPDIYRDYKKALTDIVDVYKHEIQQEDACLQENVSSIEKKETDIEQLPNGHENMLDTLKNLGAIFSPAVSSTAKDDCTDSEGGKGYDSSCIERLLSRCLTQMGTTSQVSLTNLRKSSINFDQLVDEIGFGDSIDRYGIVEEILSQNDTTNAVINPLTLTLDHEDGSDDDSFVNEEDFEQSFSNLERIPQNVDGKRYSVDRSNLGHSFVEKEDNEVLFSQSIRWERPTVELAEHASSIDAHANMKRHCVDASSISGFLFEPKFLAPTLTDVKNEASGSWTGYDRNVSTVFSNSMVQAMGLTGLCRMGEYNRSISYFEPIKVPPSTRCMRYWLQTVTDNAPEPSTCHLAPSRSSLESIVDADVLYHSGEFSTNYGQRLDHCSHEANDTASSAPNNGMQGSNVGDGASNTSQVGSSSLNLKTSSSNRKILRGLSLMSVEIHIQCRVGKSSLNKAKEISMKPDPIKDPIHAITYIYALDPANGERIVILEKGCIFVPVPNSQIGTTGISSKLNLEAVNDERHLLLRFASIIQLKDPDVLLSWDPQTSGIGYIIRRGEELRKLDMTNGHCQLDMIRLLGRTPRSLQKYDVKMNVQTKQEDDKVDDDNNPIQSRLGGSGLGAEWDDLVGAGAAANSIIGRIPLSGWKIISEEVPHPNCSYQPAMVSTILKKRLPFHDDLLLTHWYAADHAIQRYRVIEYRIAQCLATILLFDTLDIFGRAGEAARLSGVELSHSFPGIRGSQYKVEGVLLRALKSISNSERGSKHGRQVSYHGSSDNSSRSKSQSQSPWKLRRSHVGINDTNFKNDDRNNYTSYYFFSPSREDCKNQEALECQAMTLEPKSGFHFDPIVVVDFQSLYPSLIIAYNLCYSTCAGKLEYHSTRPEMCMRGKTTNRLGPFNYSERLTATVLMHHMKSLIDDAIEEKTNNRAYVLPTGSIFVSEQVLKGVLPQVLDEMLATRSMLKKVAKEYRQRFNDVSPATLRKIDAMQMALKYVANVTYGYTSATFSGRCAMPVLADAIVECGRRTLTNAINLANAMGKDPHGRWRGIEVVYGDTDSIFIKLPGRTIKQAFTFGEEFCQTVTNMNPPPVQLKLEKVYAVSLLQTKKKYCGLKFDSPEQKKPDFDAKGIETVRRDQCKLTQNVLRRALMTMFYTRNVEELRSYLYRQWSLIHAGRLPVSDFILTGRIRAHYRGGKIGPVQSALARRLSETDPGRTLLNKERLPYVIAALPGRTFKLRDCVLTPAELLEHWDSFTIHFGYYITRHLNAALKRCFSLAPFYCDIDLWYEASPKVAKPIHFWPQSKTSHGSMISSFFGSDVCAMCHRKCHADANERVVVCETCKETYSTVSFMAMQALNSIQQESNRFGRICHECNGCIENSGSYAREKLLPVKVRGVNNRLKVRYTLDGIYSPISNCMCIDCEVTYKRHELREKEVEAISLCKALRLYD